MIIVATGPAVMAVMLDFPYFGLRVEVAIGPGGFSISSNGHWLDIVLRCCVAGWPDFAEPRYGWDRSLN